MYYYGNTFELQVDDDKAADFVPFLKHYESFGPPSPLLYCRLTGRLGYRAFLSWIQANRSDRMPRLEIQVPPFEWMDEGAPGAARRHPLPSSRGAAALIAKYGLEHLLHDLISRQAMRSG
jgi:hypothetical protein